MIRLLFLLLVFTQLSFAQDHRIRGFILSTENDPIPFASIEMVNADDASSRLSINYGVAADMEGKYELKTFSGYYKLIISAVGYETKTVPITVQNEDVVLNIYLKNQSIELEEVVLNAKGRDPAYGIIKSAIESKPNNQHQFNTIENDLYIKGTLRPMNKEELKTYHAKYVAKLKKDSLKQVQRDSIKSERKQWFKNNFFHKKDTLVLDSLTVDSLQEDSVLKELRKKRQIETRRKNASNFAEIKAKRYFKVGEHVKEIREGYKLTGRYWDFFYLTTAEAQFDFYESLLQVKTLSDYNIITPLNPTSAIPYKFKLVQSYVDNGHYVHEIKVEPRRNNIPLFQGTIWIEDESWAIYRVEYELEDFALNYYDHFKIRQQYKEINDSIWVIDHQKITYVMSGEKSIGYTEVHYSNYEFNKTYDKKFFDNALLITSKKATEQDSSFWEDIRPEPLSPEEQEILAYKDSIYQVQHSKVYLDSLDSANNRYRFIHLITAYQHYNREKKLWTYYPGLGEIVNPFSVFGIGGFRSTIRGGLSKQFDDEKRLMWRGSVNYGYLNEDLNYSTSVTYLHNPINLSYFRGSYSKSYAMINNDFGMSIEQASPANFYLSEYFNFSWNREIINGLYINTGVDFSYNTPVVGIQNYDWIQNAFLQTKPLNFDPFHNAVTNLGVWFIPKQKYILEPNRKIVLGSKWPRFSLDYERSWDGFWKTRYRYDKLEFTLDQQITIRSFGESRYNFKASRTFNDENARDIFISQNAFIASDPWFFQHPLEAYSLLDTNFQTSDLVLEGHYIHHFNGFILNRVPLLNYLQLKSSVGANALYVKEQNVYHLELYAGISRDVRIFGERYRFGLFPVIKIGNTGNIFNARIKLGINFYNRYDRTWIW